MLCNKLPDDSVSGINKNNLAVMLNPQLLCCNLILESMWKFTEQLGQFVPKNYILYPIIVLIRMKKNRRFTMKQRQLLTHCCTIKIIKKEGMRYDSGKILAVVKQKERLEEWVSRRGGMANPNPE